MGVDDSLRLARRPARVTHCRGGAFVEIRPREPGRFGGDELLITQHVSQCRGIARARDDDVPHGLQLILHLGEHRDQRIVDDHDLVLGMVDDEGELIGEQPQVERVQHRAHTGHRHVSFQMLLVVPLQSADAVAVAHAEPLQRRGQALGAVGDRPEACAARLGARPGDDLAVAEELAPVPEDMLDRQREIHHGALHGRCLLEPEGCRLWRCIDSHRSSSEYP